MKRRDFMKIIAGVGAVCPIAAWAETYPSHGRLMPAYADIHHPLETISEAQAAPVTAIRRGHS